MRKVEISSKTIAFAVLFPLFLYFLWNVRDLLFSLFIAFILMSALRPPVAWLQKYKFPRPLAVVIVYLSFISFFITLITIIIPPIATESANLIINLPLIIKHINPHLPTPYGVESITQYLPNVTGQLFKFASGIFSNIIFVISTLFFGFYFLLEEDILRRFVTRFFDKRRAEQITSIFDAAEKRMNAWFWGELTLMTVIGCMMYIGLTLVGVKYSLSLAVLAGLLEVIPSLGPVLAAGPTALIGFSQSHFLGFATIALAIIVQQLENNLIVPLVMRRAVGINPVVTLIALVVGGRFGGVIGALLAIPIFLFIETVVVEFTKDGKLVEKLP